MNAIGKCAVGPALGRPGYVDCTCDECAGRADQHDSASPNCTCLECSLWRRARIQVECAHIAATHWAFSPSANDNDGDEMGAWVSVLLMRAKAIPGVAPWAPGPDDELTMGLDDVCNAESGVRPLPTAGDERAPETVRPPALSAGRKSA